MLLYTTRILIMVNIITIAQITLSPRVRFKIFPVTPCAEEKVLDIMFLLSLIVATLLYFLF